jgi:hypothetical protein
MSLADAPPPQRVSRLVAALAAMLVMTALEVLVVGLPVDRTARITALCGLVMAQALLVLTVFMRLGRQRPLLRLALLAPLVLGPGFTVALMLDTAFRVTQR